ncbi:hypothetical protein IL306_010939 [Fusarium sp. DS 682]|nr:hypothetical protein IL306_010939 [Fusarium sp. DS 682]
MYSITVVNKYIKLFGGDPDRVTVFGESAGRGSIMCRIAGAGGKEKAPFDHAIIQSPGWLPSLPVSQIWNETLAAASMRARQPVIDGANLARLDAKTLLQVNSDIVYKADYGNFAYGPTIDGGFVPDYPGVLLLKGDFDKSVDLMLGHNAHESDIFTSTTIDNEEKIKVKLRKTIFDIKD